MRRPIDADALMETINRHCYPIRHDMTSIEPGMTRIGILQAIQEQPTIEPRPQWIPVSERLPETEGVYLVYAPGYTGGSSSAKENHNGAMFSKWKNGKWSVEHGYYERPNCVRAWMPLPEPYQEDNNGTD